MRLIDQTIIISAIVTGEKSITKVEMAICFDCFVFLHKSLSIEFPPVYIWIIAHQGIYVLVRQYTAVRHQTY